jgi:hypothetical protein
MTAEMSVQFTLALVNLIIRKQPFFNPSAGIGRQDELKFRWCNTMEVQVLFRIELSSKTIVFGGRLCKNKYNLEDLPLFKLKKNNIMKNYYNNIAIIPIIRENINQNALIAREQYYIYLLKP